MLNENTESELRFNREVTPEEKSGIALVSELQNKGFEAYFVGGTVRDLMLNQEIHDVDIATNARPEKIEEIFPENIPVGKKYGVMIVPVGEHQFEIATFRQDIGYSDSRRPDEVIFSSKEFDASRRDFTVNGMFFDPIAGKIYDFVEGQKDLQNRVIRFIGEPKNRIIEDPLRLLRAIRLKNKLGFQHESKSWEVIKENSERINKISGERIRDELNKMFEDPNRIAALTDLKESGLLAQILPEVNDLEKVEQPEEYHAEGNAWRHTWRAFESLEKDASLEVIWATLLHDIGKKPAAEAAAGVVETAGKRKVYFPQHEKYSAEMANKILRRLKFPNDFREKVEWLIENHMLFLNLDKMRVAKQRRFLQNPLFPGLLQVFHADISGSLPIDFESYDYAKKLYDEETTRPKEERQKEIINGKTIIEELGINQGPEIGRLKHLTQEAYLEGKVRTKEEAIEFLKQSVLQ